MAFLVTLSLNKLWTVFCFSVLNESECQSRKSFNYPFVQQKELSIGLIAYFSPGALPRGLY